VSQAGKSSWLNDLAPQNMTSYLSLRMCPKNIEILPSKADAALNMDFMFLTTEVFHFNKSRLNNDESLRNM